TRFDDLEALRESARRAYRQGYMGSTCIHPTQVPILNGAFSPTEEELARARRIVEAYEGAESRGQGSVAVEGLMVDLPVASRARRLLRRAELIRAREEAKRLAREGAGGGGGSS
ncbi:MAG: HpcH/HpaI aldolase/citrate lyase family protein, partial [Nitrospinota bacterium]